MKNYYDEQPNGYLETIRKGIDGVRSFRDGLSFSSGDRSDHIARLRHEIETADAVVIGPGLGTDHFAQILTDGVLAQDSVPALLDADALNTLSLRGIRPDTFNPSGCARSSPVVITPHPGEMARLTGKPTIEVQKNRYRTARDFASEYGVTVVLKGANTIIALPDGNVYVNLTGNNGMAKGGSGDVLAGMMASFLSQGMNPDEAAINAVYYHGVLGDKCMEKYSARTMLPSDMIEEMKFVF